MKRTLMATVAVAGLLAPAAHAAEPRLEARAILPADATLAAPFPGVPNTDPAPAPNATQPVGGFSALLDAGNGDLYAMPDNGFGNKANSRSFILRLYKVRPRWRTEWGGRGDVVIRGAITLSDPDGKLPFPIVNEDTDERILTSAASSTGAACASGGRAPAPSPPSPSDSSLVRREEFGPSSSTPTRRQGPQRADRHPARRRQRAGRPTARTCSAARAPRAAPTASRTMALVARRRDRNPIRWPSPAIELDHPHQLGNDPIPRYAPTNNNFSSTTGSTSGTDSV